MTREFPISRNRSFKNGVLAALEICAEQRAQESGFEPAPDSHGKRFQVDRAAAIIEAAAQKIGADDFTALEALCAGHVLALDVIFGQFAREAAQKKTLSERSMGFALRAQSQCRATIKVLAALTGPRGLARRSPTGEGGRKNREIPANGLLKTRILDNDQLLAVPRPPREA